MSRDNLRLNLLLSTYPKPDWWIREEWIRKLLQNLEELGEVKVVIRGYTLTNASWDYSEFYNTKFESLYCGGLLDILRPRREGVI